MSTQLLTLKDVQKRIPAGRTTFTRWIKSGEFPPPTIIGASLFWPEDQIEIYLTSRRSDWTPSKAAEASMTGIN
ncbi:hypothetical protein GCM10010924_12190 [Rhizobium wenxiniae]|uniref:Putative DNA-binding transcriptional regulator AlpA n=1 Tax=Rhizobium wenxiniae TaxID=1737357 RepID=A0A7X0CYA2_9HYPH|nr:helix-turn-helix domain-containing protein [Rhizobium wenxiniae]MBB6161067.1 putative DNA-binding transcriptional regulator AlpA [Rhizobium wenxiniae]GGF86096.1 hypothetical protein GCM10010924_12190 [Rhizobium wenxiniae]